jgi:signal peptidase II
MLKGHSMNFMTQQKQVFIEMIVFALLIAADQASKWWAFLIQVNESIIPNFFYFSYTRNTGAAWSILEGNLPLLAGISLIAGVAMLIYYALKGSTLTSYYRWVLILIMAGTWGNFIDRAFYEEGVIDFISFQFRSYYFPTFNIADSLLTIGVILLIAMTVLEEYLWKKKPSKSK